MKRQKILYVVFSVFNMLIIVSLFFYTSIRPTFVLVSVLEAKVDGIMPEYSVKLDYSGTTKVVKAARAYGKYIRFWPSFEKAFRVEVSDRYGVLAGIQTCSIDKSTNGPYNFVLIDIRQERLGRMPVAIKC